MAPTPRISAGSQIQVEQCIVPASVCFWAGSSALRLILVSFRRSSSYRYVGRDG
jgi:hypothetical protein